MKISSTIACEGDFYWKGTPDLYQTLSFDRDIHGQIPVRVWVNCKIYFDNKLNFIPESFRNPIVFKYGVILTSNLHRYYRKVNMKAEALEFFNSLSSCPPQL